MVRAAIKAADELQRRPYVPERDRTPKRDECADWLQREMVDAERSWGETSVLQMSHESDYSREHISRTLDAYFQPVGGGRAAILEELASAVSIDTDTSDDYEGGFEDGFKSGLRFAIEHDDIFD